MKKIYILILCFFIVQHFNAQVCFQPPAYYTVSSQSTSNSQTNGLLTDFNNDGNMDVATAFGNVVSVLLGSSNGVFSAPIKDTVLSPFVSIASADLNNDGNIDIIGHYSNYYYSMGILYGDGTGHFVDSVFITSGGDYQVTCADFNKDGKIDFVTSNSSNANSISIYLGNGNGTFLTNNLTLGNPGSGFSNITNADLNGDGFNDIVTTAQHPPNGDIVILINDGSGNFSTSTTYTLADLPGNILLNDFTNDGKIDILCQYYGITIWPGNGNGSFSSSINTPITNFGAYTVADFDGDNNLDIAHGSSSAFYNVGALSISFGDGTGAFTQSQADFYYSSSPSTVNLHTADFNKDNIPDIAAVQNIPTNNIPVIMGSRSISNFLFSTSPISCWGANNGMALVTVNGSGTPFQYKWNTGQTTDTIHNIQGGTLETVTVTANNGCKAMQGSTFYAPSPISSSFYLVNSNCSSGSFVDAQASVTGGTPPLNYIWSTNPVQTNNLAVNLSPGSYSLTVTDSNGCVATSTINVGSVAKFSPSNAYSNHHARSHKIISADFNKDGIADLATSNYDSSNVSILLGTGAGNFGSVHKYKYSTTNAPPNYSFPISILVNDFNGDGNLDIAVLADNTIRVLPGTGNGSFLAPAVVSIGHKTNEGITADFNHDGKADIALYSYTDSTLMIFTGNGANGFSLARSLTVSGGTSYAQAAMTAADLNNDGFQDIILVIPQKTLVLLCNNGNINSIPFYYTSPALYYAEFVAAADMNEDGALDIIRLGMGTCRILLGDGSGGLGAPANFQLNYSTSYGAVADFNGDGHIDIAGSASNKIMIACGNGAQHLYMPAEFSVNGTAVGVCAADFDGDGKYDIATASTDSSKINIFLNCQITGINNEKQNQNIKIYPNPSAGEFIVDTQTEEKQQLQIFDITGKLVLSKSISGRVSFNMPDLQNGVYSVMLRSKQQVYTSKLVLVK